MRRIHAHLPDRMTRVPREQRPRISAGDDFRERHQGMRRAMPCARAVRNPARDLIERGVPPPAGQPLPSRSIASKRHVRARVVERGGDRLARRFLKRATPGLQRLVANKRTGIGEAAAHDLFATLDVRARRHHRQPAHLVVRIRGAGFETRTGDASAAPERQSGEAANARQLVRVLRAAFQACGSAKAVERGGLEFRDFAALPRERLEPFGGAQHRVDLNRGRRSAWQRPRDGGFHFVDIGRGRVRQASERRGHRTPDARVLLDAGAGQQPRLGVRDAFRPLGELTDRVGRLDAHVRRGRRQASASSAAMRSGRSSRPIPRTDCWRSCGSRLVRPCRSVVSSASVCARASSAAIRRSRICARWAGRQASTAEHEQQGKRTESSIDYRKRACVRDVSVSRRRRSLGELEHLRRQIAWIRDLDVGDGRRRSRDTACSLGMTNPV